MIGGIHWTFDLENLNIYISNKYSVANSNVHLNVEHYRVCFLKLKLKYEQKIKVEK